MGIPLAGVSAIIRADAGPEIASRDRDRIPPVDERRRCHSMPFGAEVQADGSVRFSLWAPTAASVLLSLDDGGQPVAMEGQGDGWFRLTTARARAGSPTRPTSADGPQCPAPSSSSVSYSRSSRISREANASRRSASVYMCDSTFGPPVPYSSCLGV